MINLFKVKKWAALILVAMLTTVSYAIGTIYYGLWIGVTCLLVGMLVSILAANLILKNPFTSMLEGRGILTFNIDSTGIIRPFVVGVQSPYIMGKFGSKNINDVFDRDAVFSMAAPVKNKTKAVTNEDGGITINLSEENYNKARFALFHYPVLIWNDQINSVLTKDFLGHEEKHIFAEHGVLYLNRKMEELTSAVRDFGRHVVELTKPVKSIFQSKWTWIILMVFVGILLIMFGPALFNAISNTAGDGAISKAIGSAKDANPITVR